jgi:hypothetical protein
MFRACATSNVFVTMQRLAVQKMASSSGLLFKSAMAKSISTKE